MFQLFVLCPFHLGLWSGESAGFTKALAFTSVSNRAASHPAVYTAAVLSREPSLPAH